MADDQQFGGQVIVPVRHRRSDFPEGGQVELGRPARPRPSPAAKLPEFHGQEPVLHQPVQLEGRSAPGQARELPAASSRLTAHPAEATKSNSFRRLSSPSEATAAILRFHGDRIMKSA